MPYLDAILAFSVTMLVVATVVSKIVDFIYGALYLRNRLFQEMLQNVAEQFKGSAEATQIVNKLLADLKQTKWSWFWEYISGQLPTSATVDTVVKSVLDGAATDETVKQLEAMLTAEGDRLTQYLRDRSRWVAFVVALVLALVFNIDSVNIADRYIQSPALSREVASKFESTLDDAKKHLDAREKAPQPGANVQANAAGANPPADQAAIESLKSSAAQLQKDFDKLKNSSFPIGQHYFPYFPYLKSINLLAFQFEFYDCPPLEVGLRWLLGIALTCLCAGLGTPFWYDLISNLSKLTSGKKEDNPRAPSNVR